MLEYEWGNPSTMMLSAGGSETELQTPQIFDHYASQSQTFNENLLSQQQHTTNTATPTFSHHHFNPPPHQQTTHVNVNVNSVFDPRSYGSASYPPPPPPPPPSVFLSLQEPLTGCGGGGGDYLLVPKSEDVCRSLEFSSRIGLNLGLGGRTYFSNSEDDFVNRLYRRSRPVVVEPGAASSNSPKCQAEGCTADLTHAKHYHRRHKVCEFHSKASTVIAAGLTQRFCQQCSRFHLLSEFDKGKRSCRKRLADHNRRRRKSQHSSTENQKSQHDNTQNLSSDNLARSPPDSGAHSSSSVTIAISSPGMSLDCSRQRQYAMPSSASSSSSSSFFFTSG